jgi:radical SAM superfamily enzyme YgiQ (UPF0313 family)
MKKINVLFVYPEFPETYWSFTHALKFISKRASFPPLGILTVAALLPGAWEKKLVDMNVSKLNDEDIKWADYVFISAMVVQRDSARRVIDRCKLFGTSIAGGGPLFTMEPEIFSDVDHLLLGEGEITVPMFLEDIEKGCPDHIYTSDEKADMSEIPIPAWGLLNMKKYASMNIQYSRGCPFDCEFCNITTLFGRVPRTKEAAQIIKELDSIYKMGWKGSVFFVDDNFIGNRKKLKNEVLPAIIEWMEERKHPFSFFTEASIDISDDEELMKMMVEAGFNKVFVGIESPNEESLIECNKFQNSNRDLIGSIKVIQKAGFEVQGGFIVGFDNDHENIFDRTISFIQESGIVTAMVGLLNAPRGTHLYKRMQKEGRLVNESTGNNTDYSINFVPRMNLEKLMEGYRNIIKTIYSPAQYYARVRVFLKDFKPIKKGTFKVNLSEINALLKSVLRLGVIGKERKHYWRLILWSLFRKPSVFPMAVTFSIYGFHFRKIFEI